MPERSELLRIVRELLAREPHLRWACVFGSVARGQPWRDLDVALMPAATFPAGALAWGLLGARLEAAAGVPVDLIDLRTSDLPLLGSLLADRVVVLDREPAARQAFEAGTMSRWLDFKPSYEAAQRIRTLAMRERLRRTD